jgi:PhnB protein
MKVKSIPEGWHTVTPRILVHEPAKLADFLRQVFGAVGSFRSDGPTELRIGDSIVMVSDAGFGPAMTAWIHLYLDDMDATYQCALEAGAISLEEPRDLPWGDRRATVRDPFGNIWQIATHREDVTMDEIRKRAAVAPPRG